MREYSDKMDIIILPKRRLVSESFDALLPDGSSASSSISGRTMCCLLSGILEITKMENGT